MDRTLLLNATFEPLLVISWQRAITMLVLEKVEVLAQYEGVVRSPRVRMRLPAVVRLVSKVRYRRTTVRFSRINIYTRDRHQCQYCGEKPKLSSLTYDHVLPKSRGGKTSWVNIVTCCARCNRKKGDRKPREAGMKLLKKPVKPTWLPVVGNTVLNKGTPEAWRPFLWHAA